MGYDEDLAERIRALVAREDGITEKRMFGGLAFLIHGNMSVSASGQGGLMLRCDPAAADGLVVQPSVERMVMRGRELAGWLRVDAGALGSDAELERLVRIGVDYARSLPPKRSQRQDRAVGRDTGQRQASVRPGRSPNSSRAAAGRRSRSTTR